MSTTHEEPAELIDADAADATPSGPAADVEGAAAPEGPPPHQPVAIGRRARSMEAALALGALALNSWALSQNGYGNTYYAAAARSMTESWHNFIYGSYDAGGFITTDKPPFSLWVQAASAKVFGYGSWSLLLPSAVAGALSVWLLTITVRRVWGRTAGLSAGLALALTPIMFAVSRSTNPDAILVCLLVASAWAVERAIATDRLRWSALAGLLVGFGFLTKMLAAGIVLPALALAVFVGGRSAWRRRIGHGALIGAGFVAVSAAWVTLMDLTAGPYVGGSEDGSAWDLVFGYNGFGRLFGNSAPGGVSFPGGGGGFGAPGGVSEFGGEPGIGRLFNMGMGDQVMWLAVPAGVALIAAFVASVRRRRLDARAGSVALLAGWAVVGYLLLAFAEGVFHNYYVSAIAPALAGLVGIGVAMLLDGGRLARVVAAATLVCTAAAQLILLRRVDAFEWLRVLSPTLLAAVAAVVLFWARRESLSRWRHHIIGAGMLSALLASAMWIGSGVTHAQSETFPDARPEAADGGIGFGPGGRGFTQPLDAALLASLEAQRTTETWTLAVSSSSEASLAIIDGYPLLAMGGFSGSDPAMTADRLAELVDGGELRFVSAGGGRGPGGFGGGLMVAEWVSAACVPAELGDLGDVDTSAIYDCKGRADDIVDAAANPPAATEPPAGGAPAPDPGTPPIGGQQPPAGGPDIEALNQCFTEQGLDPGALQQGQLDFDDPEVQAAFEACADLLPGGAPPP
jgi:4-amino-4-deoxy-L-arabinose transferase-like glycosyltransferase